MTNEYNFFWGHQFGDYRQFSNWYCTKGQLFTPDGHTVDCVEAYMMREKALLFKDYEAAEDVLDNHTDPRKCKFIGRRVKNFRQDIWDYKKEGIVYDGCLQKFRFNEDLKEVLLGTEGIIVEASATDAIWGIGFNEKRAREHLANEDDIEFLWGHNLLGKILTTVRSVIRQSAEHRPSPNSPSVQFLKECASVD